MTATLANLEDEYENEMAYNEYNYNRMNRLSEEMDVLKQEY